MQGENFLEIDFNRIVHQSSVDCRVIRCTWFLFQPPSSGTLPDKQTT